MLPPSFIPYSHGEWSMTEDIFIPFPQMKHRRGTVAKNSLCPSCLRKREDTMGRAKGSLSAQAIETRKELEYIKQLLTNPDLPELKKRAENLSPDARHAKNKYKNYQLSNDLQGLYNRYLSIM